MNRPAKPYPSRKDVDIFSRFFPESGLTLHPVGLPIPGKSL
jgi:hypothetical protein